MRRGRKKSIPSRFILTILMIFCILILFASYSFDFNGGIITTAANYIFVPMQKGLDYIGSTVAVSSEDAKSRAELQEENEELQAEIEDLNNQIATMQLQQTELEQLQELYELDQTYADYPKTAAHVISRGSSNWFNTFTIDKGTADGLSVDMNVMAGSGLVGIIISCEENFSTVRAIIDDSANVSAMISSTGDICIVSGSLEDMNSQNQILISDLEDSDHSVSEGDAVVTSNISSKYLPGLLIGYVTTLEDDANDLTRSGYITPVADFKHLNEVLVITQVKETGSDE